MKFGWIVFFKRDPGYLKMAGECAFTVPNRADAQVFPEYPAHTRELFGGSEILAVSVEHKVEICEMNHHVVREGECLPIICENAGVLMSDVVKINNIKDPNLIFPSRALILPPRGFRLC
jgi:hypothetical protein